MTLTQATVDAIVRDLRKYFFEDAVSGNSARNQGLAREIIVRYGDEVVIEGFLFATLGEFLTEQPNMLALTYALNAMPNLYNHAIDFVSARGQTGATVSLASIVTTSTDEDVRAMAAITLALPEFSNSKLLKFIQDRLNQTEGTSCRMAIALLLYQCGDDRALKTFIRDGYFFDYFSTSKSMGRMSKGELQDTIAFMYRQEILKKIFEDIATNGRGFNGPLGPSSKPWIRKQYD
ncbi:MAG TPA: HEAT repeat domain-containing protein [Anaerolineales bacterium]|nr:HEAT repeat domain-containing protein [Anaerolineales bacterium]